ILKIPKIAIRLITLVAVTADDRFGPGVSLREDAAEELLLGCLPAGPPFVQQFLDLAPDCIPVKLRFARQGFVNGLHVVEAMRTGIEKAGLVFGRHLVPETQWPLNGDSGVAEVRIVENLRGLAVREATVEPHDLGDLVAPILLLADLAALI